MIQTDTPSPLLYGGIDALETVSNVVVSNENGEIVLRFSADSIDETHQDTAQVRAACETIRDRLTDELGKLPDYLFIAVSSLDETGEDKTGNSVAREVFATQTEIRSHRFALLAAFAQGQRSVALIESDIEAKAIGLTATDQPIVAGGWGLLLGNEGSATHLTLDALKSVIRASDGLARKTVLTERVKDYFAVEELRDLIDIVSNPEGDKTRIARFAFEVERASEEGDISAIMLLGETIEWVYRLSQSILRKTEAKRLCLTGELLRDSEVISSRLMERFGNSGVEVGFPRFTGELAALAASFRMANRPFDDSFANGWFA